MKGRDLPSYVHRRKRDGKLLFRKWNGFKVVDIPMQTQFPEGDPIPFALHQERERLLNSPAPIAEGSTVKFVIEKWQRSPEYDNLARRTKQDYDKILTFLIGKLGHLEPRNIKRNHVIKWRDEWAKNASPHRSNYRLRILRIVLERAIDYGLLEVDKNAAKRVAEVKYDKIERKPWTAELVDKAREAATDRTALLFELLLGTGQRIGDVLEMRWSDFDGAGISVRQNKTKQKLWVPATQELLAALDAAPKRSVFILTNVDASGPWSYRGAHQAMMKLRVEIGAKDYDIHSLRYTATAELARVGLEDDQIMAITGHKTNRMVQLYAGEERQKARAIEAQRARESGKDKS